MEGVRPSAQGSSFLMMLGGYKVLLVLVPSSCGGMCNF